MARPLRIEYPHAFYHIIQRGIEKKEIFNSDTDKARFLDYVSRSHSSYQAIFHSYCLMRNHYHLIVETPMANISKIMHYLNTSYAVYFNAKYKRTGPLYQGRFKAIIVDKDEYLHHLSRYIHLNPVRAKIVKDPINYRWSSYRYFVMSSAVPDWLDTRTTLSIFSSDEAKARRMYKEFVLSESGMVEDPVKEGMAHGFILGGEGFIAFLKKNFIKEELDVSEIPQLRKIKDTITLSQVAEEIIRANIDDKKLERRLKMYLMRRLTPCSLKEIAVFIGNTGDTGVSQACRRVQIEQQQDNKVNSIIERAERELVGKKV